MASLRPPAAGSSISSPSLRRSMDPHLIEGLSWFLDRAPWQRALLSSGLGALVGVGIVVTMARLFGPELAEAPPAAAAASSLAALAAPAVPRLGETRATAEAAASRAPVALGAAEEPRLGATDPAPAAAATPSSDDTASATTASLEPPGEAKLAEPKPAKARKARAAKRSKKVRMQRARKTTALPARWSELYARDR